MQTKILHFKAQKVGAPYDELGLILVVFKVNRH